MAEGKKLNKARIGCAVAFLLVSLIPVLCLRERLFYYDVPKASWNAYRFWWCFSSVFFGFSAIAFVWRHVEKSPFPDYVLLYPLQLVAISTIVFGGLHLFPATSGYLFYYLVFGIGWTMGFMVDSYWAFITLIFGKGNK